jgi:hypothetical protein
MAATPTTPALSSTAKISPAGAATKNSGPSKTANRRQTAGLKNEFLMSELSCGDFRLELDISSSTTRAIRHQIAASNRKRPMPTTSATYLRLVSKLYEEHGRPPP